MAMNATPMAQFAKIIGTQQEACNDILKLEKIVEDDPEKNTAPERHERTPLPPEQHKTHNDTILRIERQLLYASKDLKPPTLPEGTESLDLREFAEGRSFGAYQFAERDAKIQLDIWRRSVGQKVLWLKQKKEANQEKLNPGYGPSDAENDSLTKDNLLHKPSDLVNELGTLGYHLGLADFLVQGRVPNLEWMAVVKILGGLMAHELDCANKMRRYHNILLARKRVMKQSDMDTSLYGKQATGIDHPTKLGLVRWCLDCRSTRAEGGEQGEAAIQLHCSPDHYMCISCLQKRMVDPNTPKICPHCDKGRTERSALDTCKRIINCFSQPGARNMAREYVDFFAKRASFDEYIDKFLTENLLDVDDHRNQCFGEDFEKLFAVLNRRYSRDLAKLKQSLYHATGISEA